MIETTCHVNSGNDAISLESRPLNFRVFIHVFPGVANTRTKSVQKQIKSKYPEEYHDVAKV